MNYKVEFAKLRDINDIKDLRHKNSKVLGIMFDEPILSSIKRQKVYVIRNENGKVICMCIITKHQKFKKKQIKSLVTEKSYRGKGLATIILYEIVRKEKGTILVEAMDGADNNKFYDGICDFITTSKDKTINSRIYVINPIKLKYKYESILKKIDKGEN